MKKNKLILYTVIGILTAVSAVGSLPVAAIGAENAEETPVLSTEAPDPIDFSEPTEPPAFSSTEITAVQNLAGGVQLSWNGLSGASYSVYYRRAAFYDGSWEDRYDGTEWSLLATVSDGAYTDTARADAEIGSYLVCRMPDDAEQLPDAGERGQENCYYAAPEIGSLTFDDSGVRLEWIPAWEKHGFYCGESYRVYRKTAGKSWTRIAQGVTDGFYTDTTAVPGTEYIYTIRMADEAADRFLSGHTAGKTIGYQMYPLLTGTENTANGMKLSWSRYPGAAKYRVYYRSGSGWTRIAQTAGTTYTDTSVKDGETRVYTIRALDAKNNFVSDYRRDGWSHRYYASPVIQSLSNADGGVKLTWQRAEGAEDYRVYRKTTGGWTRLAQTDAAEYIDTTAVSGTKYTYTLRMVGKDNAFMSYYNGGKSITYVAAPAVTALENLSNGVKVTWSRSAGAASYRLYYRAENGWTRIAQTVGTSYTDTAVLNGENRVYTVRCMDAKGNFISDFSRSGFMHTYFAPPVIKSISASESGIVLSWNRSQGAGDIRVYRKTAGASWTRIGQTADTAFTDVTAAEGVRYIYTLRMVSPETGAFMSTYLSGTEFTYLTRLDRAKWLYELLNASGVRPTVSETDAAGVFRLAKQRGILSSYTESDQTAPVTRFFAARTLCKALGYSYHSVGTVSDSDDKALSTAAYYGYFLPDESDCLYPSAELTVSEISDLLCELRLYQRLKGKTVASFGDSIMHGAGNNEQGLAVILAQKYGMKCKDYSKSGAVMGKISGRSHIADQVRSAISDGCKPALVLLNGGTNDAWIEEIPLGNIASGFSITSETDFSSGFEKTMSLIAKQWPAASVIYVRSHKMKLGTQASQQAYGTRAMTLAVKWGAAAVDMYSESDFDGSVRRIAERYTFDDDAYYRGIHPNALGYAAFYLPAVKQFL